MKKAYQIDERRAIDRFRSYLTTNPGSVQLVLPLADLAQRLRHGVSQMLFEAECELLTVIMEDEAKWRTQQPGTSRWGTAPGSVIVDGQRIPLLRPRLREGDQESKLGSYELFRRDDEMQRHMWNRVVRGLSMRAYDPLFRESPPSFGISKSTISNWFKVASGQRSLDLRKRDLSKLRLCALMLDGVEFRKELFVVALGIDKMGTKTILGYHQGATENQQICDRLLEGLAARGLDLRQGMIATLDGGGAGRASVRKFCGEKILVARCQQHKQRNVCEHFAPEERPHWEKKLSDAWDLAAYQDAKRALQQIQRELMGVNPSAARSLEEGLEETLTLHKLNVPLPLRKTLRTTNPIESVFDTVRTACRNVKRWRPGDQRERWICSGLAFAENKFRRIDGYRELPRFLDILDAQFGSSQVRRQTA
jgi:transposase-like protein